MSFDLMNGLMNGVAVGQGFGQAQDQAQLFQLQRQQMQQQGQAAAMAMLMNRMKLEDEKKNLAFQQSESAYARQLATDPDTMDLPIDHHMDLLAKNALAQGDTVRASEFATQATNFRQAAVAQDQKKALTAKTMMDSQQKLHNFMSSEMAAAVESGDENAFNQAKLLALQSGHGTPEDQANLASLQWPADPAGQARLAQALRLGGMTSRQQAKSLNEDLNAQLRKTNEARLQRNSDIRNTVQQQKLADAEQQAADKKKAGAGTKAPTQAEMDQAIPYLKDLKDQGLSPTDLGQAQLDLVTRKQQIRKRNPNISEAQALTQAKAEMAPSIQTTEVPSKIPGMSGTKQVTYKMAGATPQAPIPYTGDKSTLIPGRYYQTQSHGVVQFTGTGFLPVQ